MLTEYEARKLQDDMNRELNGTPAVVVECAVLLLLFIGLAWFGQNPNDPTTLPTPPAHLPSLLQPQRESKAVFDERRQRYIEANPDSQVAREDRAQRQKDAHADGGYFAYKGE